MIPTHVEFTSSSFPPNDPDLHGDAEVNPGRYGKLLAEYLSTGLQGRGVTAEEPVPEDWGWMVPITNDEFRLWIGVGNMDDMPDPDAVEPADRTDQARFLCFIEPSSPTVRRRRSLRSISTVEVVGDLQRHVSEVIAAHPDISAIEWRTAD